ncbi:hypothetical protein L6452_43731 [Arctium lappa]|uniref:Uncharacterized protein n=1 Tax=Arctium lappa TaxID=4217 RepID=A0ACB8XDQ1_ARCLA|nr:hypothetical protein L6452_43731 [Arctium lappa]
MTPPDIPARCPYDFFTSVTPSQLTLLDHSEELHPEGPTHLKTTSQALLQAAEVLAPTTPVALADSTLLAITCKVSGHKTWTMRLPRTPNPTLQPELPTVELDEEDEVGASNLCWVGENTWNMIGLLNPRNNPREWWPNQWLTYLVTWVAEAEPTEQPTRMKIREGDIVPTVGIELYLVEIYLKDLLYALCWMNQVSSQGGCSLGRHCDGMYLDLRHSGNFPLE